MKRAGSAEAIDTMPNVKARDFQVAEKIVSIGDVFATIYDAFGINWEKEYMTPTGRPIKIANAIGDKTGSLISELV